VDTGRLRSSIQTTGVRHDAGGSYVQVGTNVDYAVFVEFGTRHAAAQPYMRPAFANALSRWGR
jgi:HK97 gp10 family phage protein